MKKVIALVLAAVMLMSVGTTAMAAKSPSASSSSRSSKSSSSGGWSSSIVATAASKGMTASEYVNNYVESTPGISAADYMTVGQGGHVIINGAPTNTTFYLSKPGYNLVDQAKSLVPAGYKVVNVVNVSSPRVFNTATVNFWTPGVVAGMNVQVFMLVNGQLIPLSLREVRLDHIVLDMTQYGTLVFAVAGM